jgi:hypothetical protein
MTKPFWLVDFRQNARLITELPGTEIFNRAEAETIIKDLSTITGKIYQFDSIKNKTIINNDDTLLWLSTGRVKYDQGVWWFDGHKLKNLFPKTIEKSYMKLNLEDYFVNDSCQQWVVIDAIKR